MCQAVQHHVEGAAFRIVRDADQREPVGRIPSSHHLRDDEAKLCILFFARLNEAPSTGCRRKPAAFQDALFCSAWFVTPQSRRRRKASNQMLLVGQQVDIEGIVQKPQPCVVVLFSRP